MKYNPWIVLVIAAAMVVSLSVIHVRAQSALGVQPGGLLSTCPAPLAKAMIFCNVTGDTANPDGAYVSINGGSYAQVQTGAATAGVSSWNGLTGKVTYAPTQVTCSTASLTNTTGLVASSCTIK